MTGEMASAGNHTFILCLGYTYLWGERVVVFQLPVNSGKQIAVSSQTVSCRNGHPRTVTIDQTAITPRLTVAFAAESLPQYHPTMPFSAR